MKKNFIFYTLFVFTLFVFVFFVARAVNLGNKPLNIPNAYNTMNVIVETKLNTKDDVILKANNAFLQIPPSKGMLNKTLKGPVYSLEIYVKENFKNKIKGVVIFNDTNTHSFKDFSAFEKRSENLCPNGNCSVYNVYTVPNSVKFNKKSNTFNYRYPLNTFCASVLCIFKVIIPYIFLFFTIFYYIKNKNEIKVPKVNGWFVFGALFILGALLRYNGLFDYLPWADEYYSYEFSNPSEPFGSVFQDPGNPPLFYIIFKIWMKIFGTGLYSMKALPFIFGVLGLFSIWFVLKKNFDLKTANIGLFLACINIPLIYYSNEMRSYILQAFLTPLIVYYLFKILNEKKSKDFIIYGILAGLAANVHYFEILFIVSNFVYGAFCLRKDKSAFLKFFLANFFGAVLFLPFFLGTALQRGLIETRFNDWISEVTFSKVKSCIFYVTGGGVSFLFCLFALFKTFKMPAGKEKTAIIYFVFAIFFTILEGVIFSKFRPILTEKYLMVVIPLFIMFLAVFFKSAKMKYGVIVFIIWILLIQNCTFVKNNRRKCIIDGPLTLSYELKPENKNIYVITNLSSAKFLNKHKKYMIKDAIYIAKTVSETQDTLNEILKKDKNAVVFTSILDATKKNANLPDNYSCYFNSATDVCIWRIENEK